MGATCDSFSEDVKFWAEYKTGIRGFKPWLTAAEKTSTEGLSKPQTLDEANAMFAVVKAFEAGCLKHLKILDDAAQASLKMTTHKEADDEVAALRERYVKVKAVSDEWMAKCDTLVKEWQLLDNTVTELNSWVAADRGAEGEKLLSGKDGVHSWRTQKHLQREGEACRKPVNSFCKYSINKQTYISITTRSDIMLAFIIKIFAIIRDTMCPKYQALLEYSRIFLN